MNARTLGDFLQYVKATPDKTAFASPGNGTTKTRMTHVPYRSDAPAIPT